MLGKDMADDNDLVINRLERTVKDQLCLHLMSSQSI